MFLNIFSLSSSMKETTLFTGTYLGLVLNISFFPSLMVVLMQQADRIEGHKNYPTKLCSYCLIVNMTRKSKMRS